MWRTLSSEARERIGELCDEHGRHLYDYCRTALAGSDAELAVADALLSAHAHGGRLAEPRLLRPWLYALARAHRAAIATTRPASTGSWSRPGVAPDLVPEGLMALDGPHRELLDLSVRHGLTNAEIAVIFDAEAFEVAAIVAEAADTLEEWFAAVRAARTREGCPRLATRVTDWTKAPGRRNRTRIARHILSCSGCRAAPRTVRAATLLHRLPLAAVPSTLRDQPAWGRPLPADDPLWRPDGFPHQARGLVEPPPAMISLVPGPTTETREPSWPVAGAAATGQEPPRTGTAPFTATAPAGAPKGAATGGTPSRVSSGSIASRRRARGRAGRRCGHAGKGRRSLVRPHRQGALRNSTRCSPEARERGHPRAGGGQRHPSRDHHHLADSGGFRRSPRHRDRRHATQPGPRRRHPTWQRTPLSVRHGPPGHGTPTRRTPPPGPHDSRTTGETTHRPRGTRPTTRPTHRPSGDPVAAAYPHPAGGRKPFSAGAARPRPPAPQDSRRPGRGPGRQHPAPKRRTWRQTRLLRRTPSPRASRTGTRPSRTRSRPSRTRDRASRTRSRAGASETLAARTGPAGEARADMGPSTPTAGCEPARPPVHAEP